MARIVPASGKESQRVLMVQEDLLLDGEIVTTIDDQKRVFLEDQLVSAPVLHGFDGSIDSEALMLSLNDDSARGCWVGDYCLRSDLGQLFKCKLNNGETLSDWINMSLPSIATQTILARSTAGTGDVQQLSLSQVLDFVGSAANGDILYRSGGSWTRLAAGSNSQVLTISAGLPAWADSVGGGGGSKSTLYNSLLAFFPFGERAGNRIDVFNNTILTDVNTVLRATGKTRAACALFNSANSEYLNVTDGSFAFGDIDFHISGWVYLTDKASSYTIFSRWNASTTERSYTLQYTSSTDNFRFFVSSDGDASGQTDVAETTVGSPSAGTWYFIEAYHDAAANQIGIALNKNAFNTASHSGGIFSGGTVTARFGALGNGANYLNGRLQDFGIWRRVVDSGERTLLYGSGDGFTHPFS